MHVGNLVFLFIYVPPGPVVLLVYAIIHLLLHRGRMGWSQMQRLSPQGTSTRKRDSTLEPEIQKGTGPVNQGQTGRMCAWAG